MVVAHEGRYGDHKAIIATYFSQVWCGIGPELHVKYTKYVLRFHMFFKKYTHSNTLLHANKGFAETNHFYLAALEEVASFTGLFSHWFILLLKSYQKPNVTKSATQGWRSDKMDRTPGPMEKIIWSSNSQKLLSSHSLKMKCVQPKCGGAHGRCAPGDWRADNRKDNGRKEGNVGIF